MPRPVEPSWLKREWLEPAHARMLKLYGGIPGIDTHKLEQALAAPQQLWFYAEEDDRFVLAAHLMLAMNKNHGFAEGNKRMSFIATRLFLGRNGIELNVPTKLGYGITMRAARCSEDTREQTKKFIATRLRIMSGF